VYKHTTSLNDSWIQHNVSDEKNRPFLRTSMVPKDSESDIQIGEFLDFAVAAKNAELAKKETA
jgi:hypothetical protein